MAALVLVVSLLLCTAQTTMARAMEMKMKMKMEMGRLRGPRQTVTTACPSSPAVLRASCSAVFTVKDFGCTDTKEEVERRAQGKDGWSDPRTPAGTTKMRLVSATADSSTVSVTRTTPSESPDGNAAESVDMLTLKYVFDPMTGGCHVHGCSVAQTMSLLDVSSCQFCNMFNLLCGTDAGCRVCRHDMRAIDVAASTLACPFRDTERCRSLRPLFYPSSTATTTVYSYE